MEFSDLKFVRLTEPSQFALIPRVLFEQVKNADFRLCTREDLTDASSAPFSPVKIKLYWDGVLGQAAIDPHSPILSLPALTDIWIDAEGGGAGTEVSCDFEILLVDD